MAIFSFSDDDRRIFPYSKGEVDDQGNLVQVYGDPRVLDRNLDMALPNRNAMIDRHIAAEQLKFNKAKTIVAYLENTEAFLTGVVIRDYGYQQNLPDLENGIGHKPNPESPLEFAKRMNVPDPTVFTAEEEAAIKMGAIAHQDIVRGIRAAFGLKDFDEKTGKGCTDDMAIAVLNRFQDFLEKKETNIEKTPACSAPSPA